MSWPSSDHPDHYAVYDIAFRLNLRPQHWFSMLELNIQHTRKYTRKHDVLLVCNRQRILVDHHSVSLTDLKRFCSGTNSSQQS